ncbi:unnamed protein product [Adineta steineri]|nr:unnamed protein product [Adineta steineri]
MGHSTDNPGLIIHSVLGGSDHDLYNIYPKSRNPIFEDKVLSQALQIYWYVSSLKVEKQLYAKLYYSSPTATKPDKIDYAFVFNASHCNVVTLYNIW